MSSIPHLALPFNLNAPNLTAETVEQNSIEDVSNCVAVLCNTPVGGRLEVPGYGIPEMTFDETIDTSAILAAVATWEPRATVAVGVVGGNPNSQAQVTVTVGIGVQPPTLTAAPAAPAIPPPPLGVPNGNGALWGDSEWGDSTWT